MFVVLGSSGFLGSNIKNVLDKNGLLCKSYMRAVFDMNDERTFKNVELINSSEVTIIDCIARIDGNEFQLEKTNVTGFSKWINYLKQNFPKIKYTYLSSYSVLLSSIYTTNIYIRTKRTAEGILKNSGLNYKIIRLVFPFGKGESSNRLISRFIKKIHAGEKITIDSFSTNFTPITEFNSDCIELLKSNASEINYASSNLISLKELVEYMYFKLKNEPNYILSDKELIIEVKNNYKKNSDRLAVFLELNSLLYV